MLLNGGTTVARTGVRGILKSMSSKFPSLMVQGGTMWAIAEGIDAIADSGNDKDEKEGNTSGSLTADLNQIETIVNDVVVNMTTIIAVVLRQHDQERVQSARALEGERLKQLEERRWSEMRRAEEREREDRERNLTAASIAGYLLEINDRQKASSLLLEKTERLLSENPLMFPERSGMWKRSSGEQWGEVSRDLTLGQKEISSALLKLSEVARNGLGDSETVGAAGEAAALIGGFGEIKARFNRLLKNKVAGHCAEYAEREKQVIVVTSIIGVSIGTVLAYASSAVAFCVFQRKLDRKLASR